MKIQMAAFILLFSFLTGCAVTSNDYQYRMRLNHFYNLLTEDEKASLRASDYDKFGASVDQRLSADEKFRNGFIQVQRYEAVTTFDGKETGRFFKEIILREFNRGNFYRFMNLLNSTEQIAFVQNSNFGATFDQLYKTNGKFKGFIDNVRNNYCLYGYSNEDIARFFRNVSFPQVSRMELYYLLQILQKVNALDDFEKGNIQQAAKTLRDNFSKAYTLKNNFDDIQKISGITKVDLPSFLNLYNTVIMKEMDQYAVARTFDKFKNIPEK